MKGVTLEAGPKGILASELRSCQQSRGPSRDRSTEHLALALLLRQHRTVAADIDNTMSSALTNAHVRIARPTNDFAAIRHFYCEGLGLGVLYEFTDHDGFDGLMLGAPSAPYHFEFTRKKGHDAGRAPTQDNLTVFYIGKLEDWTAAVDRMREAGHEPVESFNPYWDNRGKTFEDPDGYRVVFVRGEWRS